MPYANWMPAAIIALTCYGFWGFFCKLAIEHIDAKSALFLQSIGFAVAGFITLLLLQFKVESNPKGAFFAIAAGLASGLGSLFFFIAADRGKLTTIVTMTALYPLLTLFLAYALLHEIITLKQGIGILLALVAIYLMG